MSKIQFLGVGGAFTKPLSGDLNECDFQSNVLVIAGSGKKLLVDCGGDIRFSLMQQGMSHRDIDAVYISHAHNDHVGGMEWFAFSTFFDPGYKKEKGRPALYCMATLASPLWNQSLRGGLDSIEGQKMDLTSYFDLRRIPKNGHFVWEGIRFVPVQVVHFMYEQTIKPSYGLLIAEDGVAGPTVFFTTDTQYCPWQIEKFYGMVDLIFHDCETAKFPSKVHAHYNDLRALAPTHREKMWLYHYQPGAREEFNPVADGFAGFVKKGDIFTFEHGAITCPSDTVVRLVERA